MSVKLSSKKKEGHQLNVIGKNNVDKESYGSFPLNSSRYRKTKTWHYWKSI